MPGAVRWARSNAHAAAGVLAIGLALPAWAEPSAVQPPPTARELHAGQCVAALQVHAEALVLKIKGGDESVRPLLQSRIEAGTAFVGDTYLHDTQDEHRARAIANEALEAQKSLSRSQLTTRQNQCADEGATLLAQANGLERMLVQRAASRRMQRMLEK